MDGLVNTIAPRLSIGNTAKASTWAEADAAGDNASLVADDVAEEVAGNDDAVEAAGVLDEDHGGAVDELVLESELGELAGHGL